MTKAKLVLLRHGQTDYNKQKLMTGRKDVPLTEDGKEQAREAGRLLQTLVFDKAYSSTLSRAFNTAALALEASGCNGHLLSCIEQRKEIVEVDSGDFTGRNHKTDPEIVNWLRAYDKPLPNGESDKQVVERVQEFFDKEVMPRLLKGENVFIVSHAGTFRAFEIVLGVEDVPESGIWAAKKRVPNATPTVYEYEDGKLTHHYQLENTKELEAANQNKPEKKPKFGG